MSFGLFDRNLDCSSYVVRSSNLCKRPAKFRDDWHFATALHVDSGRFRKLIEKAVETP